MSEPGKNSRKLQAEATRSAILAAAAAIVDEKGEAALRVAEVSERAGFSVPLIYHYFTNRDDLVAAVHVAQYLEFVGSDLVYMAAVVDTASTPEELVSMMREVSRAVSSSQRAENRLRRAEILGAARRRPNLAQQLAQAQHEVNAELTRITARAQDRGLLDPTLDAKAIALFVQTLALGLVLSDVDQELDLGMTEWLDVVTRFAAAVTPAGAPLSTPQAPNSDLSPLAGDPITAD